MKIIILLSALAMIVTCTQREDSKPAKNTRSVEETVKTFIELSSKAGEISDRLKLKKLCVGELRRTFDRMSDDIFKISYIESKVEVQSLDLLKTKKEKNFAKVKYRVSVKNPQGTDETQEINEREVDLVRSDGEWYIESIRLMGSDKIAFTRGMIF